MNSSHNLDTLLGKLVVDQGLATADEVRRCVEQQKQLLEDGRDRSINLTDLLISNGVVTRKQVERLRPQLEEQRASRQIPGYQMIRKLGNGAMATVYLAKQLSLDRLVAIKVLPPRYTKNAEFVDRFYAEGRAAAKLNHPNIVAALDVGQAGEYHYFVMEYVEGNTVFDELLERKRYPENEALNIILQTAQALDHAHKAGLIHRDVKPKNIMITKEGVAKLADMGLARALSDREAAEAEQGRAYGTPYYISPEQIRGEIGVDFRADIYCLGATAYHMLTGRVPFEGVKPTVVMHKHLKSELKPPDHLNPHLSAGICEIIEVCLAKDRNQRYDTTADLLQDLEAVAGNQPPLQARKKFDLATLSALDASDSDRPVPNKKSSSKQSRGQGSFAASPLFWMAVLGWLAALAMFAMWWRNTPG